MDGLLIIDKPAGWTSHDVVARARRILRERRIGHTGTLDPFATGVLVLLVGRATRLAQFLSNAEKEYEATVRLGYATDTGDLTGKPLGKVEPYIEPSDEELASALQSLRGEIQQVPPMYSAKKVEGRKLYELARRGDVIERKPVRVTIFELESTPFPRDGGVEEGPQEGKRDIGIRVVCSAGTYIRVLAEAIGELLGTAAHLASLRRTRAGKFEIKDARTLERLQTEVERNESVKLLSMNMALSHLPVAHLTGEEARRVRHGAGVEARNPASVWIEGEQMRLCDDEENLLAVGVYDAAQGLLRPRVMLATGENNP
jgi:tRNA pseudouridine55 synthase